jgi:monoamine oxidase
VQNRSFLRRAIAGAGGCLPWYDFYKGIFCEFGGEFVDSNHEDLIKLAGELGLEMQRLDVDGGEDLYFFGGIFHTPQDMVDPEKKTGAFVPIAEKIAEDAGKLLDVEENWTDYAHELDKMSLKTYLERFRSQTDDWAIDLLDVAYVGEYGLETEDQSSLNLVDFIGTDLAEPFQIFGESDEAFRIKDGSSALINALVDALKDKAEMHLGHALAAVDGDGERIALTLDAPAGTRSESFDAVILTLPFTRLREVKGLKSLALEPLKLNAIRELGYGTSAKLYNGTVSRVWRSAESGLPAPSNGSFYSDLGFQSLWEMSRAQPGEAGIITNFLGGRPVWPSRAPPLILSVPASPRCRPRWPKASTRRRSRPSSGPPIPTRSAATRAPRWVNIRRCWTWRQNPLLTAACSLPASIRASISLAI